MPFDRRVGVVRLGSGTWLNELARVWLIGAYGLAKDNATTRRMKNSINHPILFGRRLTYS